MDIVFQSSRNTNMNPLFRFFIFPSLLLMQVGHAQSLSKEQLYKAHSEYENGASTFFLPSGSTNELFGAWHMVYQYNFNIPSMRDSIMVRQVDGWHDIEWYGTEFAIPTDAKPDIVFKRDGTNSIGQIYQGEYGGAAFPCHHRGNVTTEGVAYVISVDQLICLNSVGSVVYRVLSPEIAYARRFRLFDIDGLLYATDNDEIFVIRPLM